MYKKIALLSLIIVLTLVNWSIYAKEQHLKHGQVVYLELAPIDPRSLMQGDYMALRFTLSNAIYKALPRNKTKHLRHNVDASDGEVIVTLDKNNKGTFKALYTHQSLSHNEIRMHYRVRNGKVKLASNAFFFQEGQAKMYVKAKYGEFKVKDGALLLSHMYNSNLKKLGKEN